MTTSTTDAEGGEPRPAVRSRAAGWTAALAVAVLALAGTACVAPPQGADPLAGATTTAPQRVDPRNYTVRIRAAGCEGVGVGSGFAIDDHTIVTNRHVVRGADKLAIETYDGQDLTVEVASQGTLADLAIVKVRTTMPDVAKLAAADPNPGTAVRAYGYPGGGPLRVTRGTVDDYAPSADPAMVGKVIRARLEVHPGNSGGPALDDDDQVVGVVYAIERSSNDALIVPRSTLFELLHDERRTVPVAGC